MRKLEIKDAEIMRIAVQRRSFGPKSSGMITGFTAFCSFALELVVFRLLIFLAMDLAPFSTGCVNLKKTDSQVWRSRLGQDGLP